MQNENSYKIDAISEDKYIEVERLKHQVDLFWDKEIKHYLEFGLKDGMSLIEFGCGPGYLTRKLLNYFPNIQITSIEIDSFLVDFAKEQLSQEKLDRFQIINGSILDTQLPDNSFDFAITRLVIEHLPRPIDAMKEVYRVLKPKGKAVFVDNDFELHTLTYPEISKLRELFDAYCQAREDEGGNPRVGRILPRLLKKAGFSEIDFGLVCAHSDLAGVDVFLKSEGAGIPAKLVHDGYLPSSTLGEISEDWLNMLDHEERSIIRQLSIAVGEKVVA